MLTASYTRHDLKFKFKAITSRQVMTVKETYFVKVTDLGSGLSGVGECAVFRGLGADDTPLYESIVAGLCRNINSIDINSIRESSIKFGFETAMRDLINGGTHNIFESGWQLGLSDIPINGLVWMGDFDTMLKRIDRKISEKYSCIKIKIGGIDFDREVDLIRHVRDSFPSDQLTLRLDANCSMRPDDALGKLERLARYDIHSIEQPIGTRQWKFMREITRNSPIDIALDEELIGNMDYDRRCYLLDGTMPRYVILKPSLHGGFSTCDGWIKDATERGIGWWATSALESDIGLNAIAQWTASKKTDMPQGLGTGTLYSNNITSPLRVDNGRLCYDINAVWGEPAFRPRSPIPVKSGADSL